MRAALRVRARDRRKRLLKLRKRVVKGRRLERIGRTR
jgi:hypothetical protein